MSAALIDLVSVGAQDVYITGDPQVSFFRQNYKRHTNFAIKPERLDYIGTFGSGNEVSIPIKSKGDLLSYIWIEGTNINAKDNDGSIYNFNDITSPTEFSLWIGGQEVSKLDSGFINSAYTALYNTTEAKASAWASCDVKGDNSSNNSYVIPFFFSEDWTKSLPLVGLQYHQVEIRIKCRNGTFDPESTPKVYGSYIFLDTEEREFFAKTEHEMLITQTQFQPMTGTEKTIDLTYFNHPVKAVHIAAFGTTAAYAFSSDGTGTASMFINGTPLFEDMSLEYHRNVVPTRHCSYFPPGAKDEPIATWPFALTIDKSQPTGTLNFSRIDSAKITISDPQVSNADFVRAYAVNYNILRIKNGMGGVAFGN